MQELKDRKRELGFVQGASRSETWSIAEKEARACLHDQATAAVDVTDMAAYIDRILLDVWTGEPPIISSIDIDDCAVLPPGAFYKRVQTGREVNASTYVRILDQRNNGAPLAFPPTRLILESDSPLSSGRVSMIRSEVFPRCSRTLVSALQIAFDVTTAGGNESRAGEVSRPQETYTRQRGHNFMTGARGVPWNVHPHDDVDGIVRVNVGLMRDFLAPLGIRVPADVAKLRSLCISELLSVTDISQMPCAHQSCGFELYACLGRMLRFMKW